MRPRATEFRQLKRFESAKSRLRDSIRKSAIFLMSAAAKIPADRAYVAFLLYHHVFDDERKDFERHLRFLRNHGNFLAFDDAIRMIAEPSGTKGRYFSITFDDGFRNCFTNATPILIEHKAPAIFFVPTNYIGKDLDGDWELTRRFFEVCGYPLPIEFLTWDDCRQMQSAGMTFGSHTCSHLRLSNLDVDSVRRELTESKRIIERQLGRPCVHFACPWGQPGSDFDPAIHPKLAKDIGFKSFATTQRGPNCGLANPMMLKRDVFRAGDSDWMLRYFLSKAS